MTSWFRQQPLRRFRHARLWWCMVLALVGCAATTTPTATPASSPPAQQPPPQITTLTVWHSWSGAQQEAFNVLARQYEQSNTLVRLRLEVQPAATLVDRFGAQVADASAPQVVIVPGRYLGELADRQYVRPLDEATFPLDTLVPAAVDAGRVAQQLYGVPLAWDALVLFWDRQTIADAPTSFEDLTRLQPSTPVSDTAQWSLGYYLSLERTLPYLPVWDGALFNADRQPVFASDSRDATVGWLEWLRALHTDPAVLATDDFSELDARIADGRVLSVIDWARTRSEYEQLWKNNLGIGPLPPLRGKPPRTLLRAEVAAINTVTTDEQQRAAEAFVRYAIGQEAQTLLAEQSRGSVLPAHREAAVDESGAAIRAAAANAQALNSDMTAAWEPLDEMVQSVLRNNASAAEAVDQAATAVGNKD